MPGIKCLSSFDQTGYGVAAQAYVRGLLNAGFPLTWMPLVFRRVGYVPWRPGRGPMPFAVDAASGNPVDPADVRLLDAIDRVLDYDTLLAHTVPEYWPGCWQPGKRRIGYTVWETDHIPSHWPPLLNSAQRIFVPSRFNAEIFRDGGVRCPVSVIPHIRRLPSEFTSTEIADLRARLGISADQFVFYTINTWTARKAMWDTVTAFLEAFTANDPVILVIKTEFLGLCRQDSRMTAPCRQLAAELRAGYRNPPEIRVLDQFLSTREIDLLHRTGDCYVSLTHGEGWGLGAFEAAAIGNPVIITGWGGHLDYLPGESAGLVNYRLTPVVDVRDFRSYEPRQRWAQANLEHAVELMREVVRDPVAARARAALACDYIAAELSETPVINRLLRALDEPDTP